MATHTILILIVLAVLLFLLYQVYELKNDDLVEPRDIRMSLEESLKKSGIYEDIGKISSQADEMKDLHRDIASMLENPQKRGSFGEQQLEMILEDILPRDMYSIRKKVFESKIPDAYIKTSSGKLCVDSKFPMENYRKMKEINGDGKKLSRKFKKDVERHLKKIKKDYVRPDMGTVNTAFAFIPSESIYYYLVSEEYDMVEKFASKGVQIVSPLTFGHKMQLIKADIKSHKLSEKAESVKKSLEKIKKSVKRFEDNWSTLRNHISNAKNKSDKVDSDFKELKENFESVSDMDEI